MDSHHQKLTNYNTQRTGKYVFFSERKVQRKENYCAGCSSYLTLSTKNTKWILKLLCSMYVILKTFVETKLLFLISSLSERLHYLKMNIFVVNNIKFQSEDYHKYEIDFIGETKTLTLLLVKN